MRNGLRETVEVFYFTPCWRREETKEGMERRALQCLRAKGYQWNWVWAKARSLGGRLRGRRFSALVCMVGRVSK